VPSLRSDSNASGAWRGRSSGSGSPRPWGPPREVGKFLVGSGKRDPDHPGDREFEIVEVAAGTRTDVRVLDPPITDRDTTLAGELAVDETTASHVRTIREIVADHESTLIFVNTRQTAEALGSRFKTLAEREEKAGSIDDPPEIEVHHGSLSKDVRIDVEDRFKASETASSAPPRWNSASTWGASTTWCSTGVRARLPAYSNGSGAPDTAAIWSPRAPS